MTELLEVRLSEIVEKVDHGIIELHDAKFLLNMLKQQAKIIEELRESE